MRSVRTSVSVIALGIALASSAVAESPKSPYLQPNNSWISISGTVDSVSADAFVLDYGQGIVTVEMDDGDRDADGYKLVKGDKVSVSGFVDDDLFETTTIEASSVYVENLGTWFFASGLDEEDRDTFITVTTPLVMSETVLQGTVTDVGDEEFTVDTGLREITVEIDGLPYNPLDDEGYQKIEKGDFVSVTGDMTSGFFEDHILEADLVTIISSS